MVNVTSIAGSRVHPFAGAAYSTSKAALAALTREMAADFGPLGVRVNAISPGEIDTAILSPGTEKIVETLPLRRLGQPSEVADVIWFLCTNQSSYVTGTEIEQHGGELERGGARRGQQHVSRAELGREQSTHRAAVGPARRRAAAGDGGVRKFLTNHR